MFLHHFAEADTGLGLNWQSFLFQLITFVIVLLVLRQFVFKKLVSTLEARRLTVEKSLTDAARVEAELKKANKKAESILQEARLEATGLIDVAHKEAAQLLETAEKKAIKRAEYITKEAQTAMNAELNAARGALKAETAKLVAMATEHIIRQKLDSAHDAQLISAAIAVSKKEPAND